MTEPLAQLFARAGCQPLDVPVLQPADAYLNTVGEAFRKSVFVTQSADGETLCLRPEFTIPVCHHHMAATEGTARYSYQGRVFRQRFRTDLRPSEFIQAGVESFGDKDAAQADAEMVALALQAVQIDLDMEPEILIGDSAIFNAFIEPVGLSNIWQERLVRAFGDDTILKNVLDRMVAPQAGGSSPMSQEFSELIEADKREALIEALENHMDEHGVLNVGGRSAADIADRALKKHSANTVVAPHIADLCRSFLAVECDGNQVRDALTPLSDETGADLTQPLENFERRFSVGLSSLNAPIRYSARFGRRLDYYTGFVFEIYDARNREKGPVAGGGRYDKLTEVLGGSRLPAVGFSVWHDRIRQGQTHD